MDARTRRAAPRAALLLAAAAAACALAAACFPSFEFAGDDDGSEGGVLGHTDGGAARDGMAGGGADAGDATTGTSDANAGTLDATTDGPPSGGSQDGSSADSAVDAGMLADLVLLLHLDEAAYAGTAPFLDSSGNGNNGALAGDVSGVNPMPTAGKFGGAAYFKGSGWIEVPNSASLTLSGKFTLAAWVNYGTALGANVSPGIIVKRAAVGFSSYTLFIWNNASAVQAYVDVENTRLNSTPQVQATGTWYHLAAVYDGTVPSATVYVNGVATPPTTAGIPPTLPASTLPVRIGDLPDGGNTLTNGKIDEVAIWSRALGAAEILALAKATGPL